MKIALIDPFHTGSHRAWAEGVAQHLGHEVRLFTLPGRHWKWRMHGAAASLAQEYLDSGFRAEVVLTTDMLALDTFAALCRRALSHTRLDLYFHENQLTYPWSPTDPDRKLRRDNHYAFINLSSALAADRVFFNSDYHRHSFLGALPDFLRQFPSPSLLPLLPGLEARCETLPLGLDLRALDTAPAPPSEQAVLLWNHRWEYDKGPEDFFRVLFRLEEEGMDFRLIVLGRSYGKTPAIFAEARERLKERILHWGYVASRKEYAHLLRRADILPVTSRQDFFGMSVVEAMYCGVFPLLPDRLAYPEHLPEGWEDQCLYRDEKALLAKLRNLISSFAERPITPLADFVSRYDWRNLRALYDSRL